LEATGTFQANPEAQQYAMHAFGAQFAEVRVNMDTGEVRVPRLLGVFAAGHIINPKTARSQFLGGMTWGLSMALHEESVLDPRFGDYVNHDFAEYHIATNADVGEIDVSWIEEDDPHVNPMGVKALARSASSAPPLPSPTPSIMPRASASAICRSHSISCCRETTAAKSGFSVTRAQTAYATLRGREAVKAALS
jgi:xanthine dehydrogenase molybdopterin-binding subunit B